MGHILVLGGVVVGRGFEPQSDHELFSTVVLHWDTMLFVQKNHYTISCCFYGNFYVQPFLDMLISLVSFQLALYTVKFLF
jgi:hypothetical protein